MKTKQGIRKTSGDGPRSMASPTKSPRRRDRSSKSDQNEYEDNDAGDMLEMLAEVAAQKLHSETSVKSVAMKKLFTDDVKFTSRRNDLSPTKGSKLKHNELAKVKPTESSALGFEDIKVMTDKQLMRSFAEFDCDEIKRTYTFVCFFMPDRCQERFSSFGSESRSNHQMLCHLKNHVEKLENGKRGVKRHFAAEPVEARKRRLGLELIRRNKTNADRVKDIEVLQKRKPKPNEGKENSHISLSKKSRTSKSKYSLFEISNEHNEDIFQQMIKEELPDTESEDDENYPEFPTAFDEEEVITEISLERNEVELVDHDYTGQLEETLEGVVQHEELIETEIINDDWCQDTHLTILQGNGEDGINWFGNENDIIISGTGDVATEIEVPIITEPAPYPIIRSADLPILQDNRVANNNFNGIDLNDVVERDEYLEQRKPKGRAKFIGQSKAEKEMALWMIESIQKKITTTDSLECHICKPPRTFTAPTTLVSHYRSHAGIKPFECRTCGAVFTRQHSLNYHMLIHTNQTRFTCSDCGRKFRHPSHFKEHKRRHTGESPFECSDCFLRFKTRNTYKRHLKTRHGKVLTTSGGLIILSEEEFNKVRTVPRNFTRIKQTTIVTNTYQPGNASATKQFPNDDDDNISVSFDDSNGSLVEENFFVEQESQTKTESDIAAELLNDEMNIAKEEEVQDESFTETSEEFVDENEVFVLDPKYLGDDNITEITSSTSAIRSLPKVNIQSIWNKVKFEFQEGSPDNSNNCDIVPVLVHDPFVVENELD